MPHFCCGEPFDWEAFKRHMNFTDEDLKEWMSDPKRVEATKIMCSPKMQRTWLIVEVVKSKGCANGLKPGDRLYFKGIGNLDPTRSSNWCGHCMMFLPLIQDAIHNLIMQGKEPKEINEILYPNYFSCVDTTYKYGWGYVECRAFVVDEDDLDKV
ncbi:MAG: hypothetical protein QXY75_04935 [Candidatus Bathyarchaeia archaeon]